MLRAMFMSRVKQRRPIFQPPEVPPTVFRLFAVVASNRRPFADAFLVAIQENCAARTSVYFTVANVSFPPSPVGTANVPQFVGIVNGGEAPLHIFSLNLIGPNASDFSLIAPRLHGAPINPGAFCSFEVGFDPSIAGPEGAAISFSDDATGNPQVLELRGQGGSESQPLAVPSRGSILGRSPSGRSAPATITLDNKGAGPLTSSSVTLAGADRLQFTSPFPADTCVAGAVIQPRSMRIERDVLAQCDRYIPCRN